jgi:hypothetical protein
MIVVVVDSLNEPVLPGLQCRFESLSEKWELACDSAFGRAFLCTVPYSPLGGCAERFASLMAKIPRRGRIPISQTDAEKWELVGDSAFGHSMNGAPPGRLSDFFRVAQPYPGRQIL